ncbi:MAG: GIY-YIG nuclease family protein [Cyanobacteria bacterium P01_F01_bin.13]
MRDRHHPSRWASVLLEDRSRLPQTSGVYAVIKHRKIYYIGFSTNLNRRWRGKGHHRFAQADKLGHPSLHYLPLPKQYAQTLEKALIAKYSPLWNYSKVPVLRKVNWMQRLLMAATFLLVLFILRRSWFLGLIATVVAIALFQ